MEGKENSAVLRSGGGFGCGGARFTTSISGVESSPEVKRISGDEEGSRRRLGGWEDTSAGTQEEPGAVAADDQAVRPACSVVDGGGCETYERGGKRERVEERFDLVPAVALTAVAKAMALGAGKYGESNWRGLPQSNCINHALRHIYMYLGGDRSEEHLSHAAANILMSIELEDRDAGRCRSRCTG